MNDIDKIELFQSLGYAADYQALEDCLIEKGLTHRRKKRIHLDKRERVRTVLQSTSSGSAAVRSAAETPSKPPVAGGWWPP